MNCRHCGEPLTQRFADLGMAPISNYYPDKPEKSEEKLLFSLAVDVCTHCWLVQTVETIAREQLFTADYPYFSSTSDSWMKHSRDFAFEMKDRMSLSYKDLVVEIGSNDGYLLRNFLELGIPCLGVEPTLSTAVASRNLGIPTLHSFFSLEVANEIIAESGQATLVVANNVMAHVPDVNDFVRGIAKLLAPEGIVSVEFPHLLHLVNGLQFDTIYHEHYSYFSLLSVTNIFEEFGLRVCDVEEIGTHGGSLRITACHKEASYSVKANVAKVAEDEREAGLGTLAAYRAFQGKMEEVKSNFLEFLKDVKKRDEKVFAYGAAAKGVTFLNFCGVTSEDIQVVFDLAPSKQGKFLPGSNVPILAPSEIESLKPQYLLLLPWNIKDEIARQQSQIYKWGGKFVTAIPEVELW